MNDSFLSNEERMNDPRVLTELNHEKREHTSELVKESTGSCVSLVAVAP